MPSAQAANEEPEGSNELSTSRPTDSRRSSIAFAFSSVAFIAVHVALVNSFVPFNVAFGSKPIQGFDYDLHIGQVFRVVKSLEHWGKSWSYDTQLLAGQPEGTITDAGSKGWELWTYCLNSLGVPLPIAFNSFVLAVMLSAPLWLYLAARKLHLTRWGSLLTAAMASTLWFFDSHLHWIWFVGMISWSGASCLAILTIASFYRYAEEPTPAAGAGAALGLSASLLIHPYTFFVLGPPLIAMTVRAWRSFSRAALGGIAAIATTSLLVNAFWLHNASSHWHYILDSAFFAQASPLHFVCDLLDVLCSGTDTGVIGTRTGFRFLYLGFAIVTLVMWRKDRDDRLLPIGFSLLALYAFAYLGAYIPGMQQTQPYRQVTPAMLVGCIPAAAFLTNEAVARLLARSSFAFRALIVVGALALTKLLLATQVLYFFPELVPRPAIQSDGSRSPLSGYGHPAHPDFPDHVRYDLPHASSGYDQGIEHILQWFRTHARAGDRVLVESPVLGERMAWQGQFEVLGGFFERNVMHVDANFFRRNLDQVVNAEDLELYLRMFAVQWVVGDRPEFRRAPHLLRRIESSTPSPIYESLVPANRVLSGGGKIAAIQNQIDVSNSDPNQTLLLSYHWHEALRCKPDCRVERYKLAFDRVGLIRVPAPHPPDLTIWNSYESW